MRARNRWALVFVLPVLAWVWLATTKAHATDLGTAIVAVHGGGWWTGTPAKMNAVCTDLVVLGYDCFQPVYTLSGVAPFNAANADLRDFVTDLRAQGYTKIIGIGASAGGNLIGWLAEKGLIDAAVTLSAPSDLVVLKDWWRAGCACWVVDQFVPTDLKKQLASPALGTVEVPILIYHASGETLIPKGQAIRLRDASTQPTLRILWGDSRHAMAYWPDVRDDVAGWIGALP